MGMPRLGRGAEKITINRPAPLLLVKKVISSPHISRI